MKTVIFGAAGSGKTCLFSALVGPEAQGLGRAKVYEPRLEPLIELYKPKKVTYAEIEYQDIPGGSEINERLLNEVRPADCLLIMLDAFSGADDPQNQWKKMESEILFSDLLAVEKRLEKINIDKKKNKSLVDPKQEELLIEAKSLLDSEKPLRINSQLINAPELKTFRFLSAKPIVYVWNVKEDQINNYPLPIQQDGVEHLVLSAQLEKDLREIEDPSEKQAFLSDLGLKETALEKVIAATYRALGLITFLTAGEKEVRSWPLKRDSKAPQAAGVIHSDLEKGFIRALTLGWDDFLKVRDFKKAKELGLLRKEGKEYVVQDGDILEFLFNV